MSTFQPNCNNTSELYALGAAVLASNVGHCAFQHPTLPADWTLFWSFPTLVLGLFTLALIIQHDLHVYSGFKVFIFAIWHVFKSIQHVSLKTWFDSPCMPHPCFWLFNIDSEHGDFCFNYLAWFAYPQLLHGIKIMFTNKCIHILQKTWV